MDIAQQVGYLTGMQEATQRELQRLATAQETTSTDVKTLQRTAVTKDEVKAMKDDLAAKIDEAVTKIQGGSGVQQAQSQQGWAGIISAIAKSPVTPMVIVVAAMALVIAMLFSRETGKPVATYLPYPTASVPPGGAATTTTTVTAPPAETPP